MATDVETGATQLNLSDDVIEAFAASLRGELIRPRDAQYDAARAIWNGQIDKYPALIARCAGAADVVVAVNFAREHGLLLAVRGGGHNAAGNALCDGGLVVDLSSMQGIRVDPDARRARAEGGVLWRDLDRETLAFGLATVGGNVSTTGIAGYTLGGGHGWLSGLYGLACDDLRAADVVLADGRLVHASEHEHPDLFWALRGGGGNFGVVTSFEYELHPTANVLAGVVLYPFEQAREVLRFHREQMADIPDELAYGIAIADFPGVGTVIGAGFCYAGDPDEGRRVIAPLRAFGAPLMDTVDVVPYLAWQAGYDDFFPAGRRNYWKSHYADQLNDRAIETIVEFVGKRPVATSAVSIETLNGAQRRVPVTATAYANRDAAMQVLIFAMWDDPATDDANIAWAREFYAALQRDLPGGTFVNFMSFDETQERVRAAYRENYDRLVEVKQRYDPTNLFRLNQNIKPDASAL
jgi:FAD/FMN-containing dehydrogenase